MILRIKPLKETGCRNYICPQISSLKSENIESYPASRPKCSDTSVERFERLFNVSSTLVSKSCLILTGLADTKKLKRMLSYRSEF